MKKCIILICIDLLTILASIGKSKIVQSLYRTVLLNDQQENLRHPPLSKVCKYNSELNSMNKQFLEKIARKTISDTFFFRISKFV